MLLKAGVDIDAPVDDQKSTALIRAIKQFLQEEGKSKERYEERIICLLANKAGINVADRSGNTPLHLAHDARLAAVLLREGANPNAKNNRGQTPLIYAIDASSLGQITQLLSLNLSEEEILEAWSEFLSFWVLFGAELKKRLNGKHADFIKITEAFMEHGIELNKPVPVLLRTPLYIAVEHFIEYVRDPINFSEKEAKINYGQAIGYAEEMAYYIKFLVKEIKCLPGFASSLKASLALFQNKLKEDKAPPKGSRLRILFEIVLVTLEIELEIEEEEKKRQ
jgi:ankyrin repeat protein